MARSTKGLYKRGNVWWITYFDALGRQRFESSRSSNKKEGERCLVYRRKEAHEGLLPAASIKPLAFNDLRERYLVFVGHQRGGEENTLCSLLPNLAQPSYSLDQYRAQRLGEKVGPATISREMATLKHALSKAVEWKLLRKALREELTAIKKYQDRDGRLRYLSGAEEADRLLQGCDEALKPIVLTAIHTGMRKGELLGLTWDQVDMIGFCPAFTDT